MPTHRRSDKPTGSTGSLWPFNQPGRARLAAAFRFWKEWQPNRLGFGVLIALAATVLALSEVADHQTKSDLRAGRLLADSRAQSLRLLLLMKDLEAAEFAFLATGKTDYLQKFRLLEKTVPDALAGFLGQGDAAGAAIATHLGEKTQAYLANADRGFQVAQDGDFPGAAALADSQQGRGALTSLTETLQSQFNEALSTRVMRDAIDRSLRFQRLALAALTLLSALVIYLVMRQLKAQAQQREILRAQLAAERHKLEEEVRQRTARLLELAGHLQTVSENERAHLARELHDELGGILTVCKLEIARARSKAAGIDDVLTRLDRVNLHLNSGIALKRRIIEDLRPSALTHLGLLVALENLCRDMSSSLGMPVNLTMTPFRLSPDAELSVYRFVQEALTNAGKYAGASAVQVSLAVAQGQVMVSVADNGAGFDTAASRAGHHGLAGMQFRAESLGGAMHVRSGPGEGTTVQIEFPEVPLMPPVLRALAV